MLNLGGGELILIALVALLFIPPKKLPGAARSIGRFLSQMRTTFEEVKKEIANPSDEAPRINVRGSGERHLAATGGERSKQANPATRGQTARCSLTREAQQSLLAPEGATLAPKNDKPDRK